jgi:hypothetical protein
MKPAILTLTIAQYEYSFGLSLNQCCAMCADSAPSCFSTIAISSGKSFAFAVDGTRLPLSCHSKTVARPSCCGAKDVIDQNILLLVSGALLKLRRVVGARAMMQFDIPLRVAPAQIGYNGFARQIVRKDAGRPDLDERQRAKPVE